MTEPDLRPDQEPRTREAFAEPSAGRGNAALILVAAAVLGIVAGGAWFVLSDDSEGQELEVVAPSTTTEVSTPDTTGPIATVEVTEEESADTVTTVPETSEAAPVDTSNAALSDPDWFRYSIDGVARSNGVLIDETGGLGWYIARLAGGDVYFLTEDGVLRRIPFGSVEAERVDFGEEVSWFTVVNGELIWRDSDGNMRDLDGEPIEVPGINDPEIFGTILAANGLAVRTRSGEAVYGEAYVPRIVEPGGIELLGVDGQVIRFVELSGPSANSVWVTDFDGRFVVVNRAPPEPALGPPETFIIDLTCEDGCPERTFGGGAIVLANPDERGPVEVAFQGLRLCPETASFAASAPGVLSDSAAATFDSLVHGLQTCDPFTVRIFDDTPWAGIAAALTGELTMTDGFASFVDPLGRAVITIEPGGQFSVHIPN